MSSGVPSDKNSLNTVRLLNPPILYRDKASAVSRSVASSLNPTAAKTPLVDFTGLVSARTADRKSANVPFSVFVSEA